MITESQYNELKTRYDARQAYTAQFKRNWLSAEESANGPQITNDEIGEIELYEWVTNPPTRYFLYVKRDSNERVGIARYRGIATAWPGTVLGKVIFSRRATRSNFGDMRVAITVIGNNGIIYYGTFYESTGDYARITAYKDQAKARKEFAFYLPEGY